MHYQHIGLRDGLTQHRHTHSGVHSIDYRAYISGINNWNPAFKTVLAVGTLMICIAANSLWVSLAVILAMGWVSVKFGGVPLHEYVALLRIPLVFLLLSGIAVACDPAKAPIGDWNVSLHWFYISFTAGRVRFALLLTCRALGAVSAMYLLALSTPASELAGVLRRAHLPALLTELMYLIYRFIFILLDTNNRMKDAAESRLGYRNFFTSCRSFGASAGSLLIIALRKSGTYYDAMVSRGYTGEMCFLEMQRPVQPGQALYAAVFWVMLVALRLATG